MKRILWSVAIIAFNVLPAAHSHAQSGPKCLPVIGKTYSQNLIDKFSMSMLQRSAYDRVIPIPEAQQWAKKLEKAAWEDAMICMDMWDDETNMQAKIDKLEYEVARLKREIDQLKAIAGFPVKK